jgi:hypothetical protein
MLHCKKLLASPMRSAYIGYAARRLARLVCFLGRFLPKLGGAQAPPFFLSLVRALMHGCSADENPKTGYR